MDDENLKPVADILRGGGAQAEELVKFLESAAFRMMEDAEVIRSRDYLDDERIPNRMAQQGANMQQCARVMRRYFVDGLRQTEISAEDGTAQPLVCYRLQRGMHFITEIKARNAKA